MRALITGATGFIGAHLAKTLMERGVEVRALVRGGPALPRLERLGVELIQGDVTMPGTLPAAVEGIDVVYHLAGAVRAFSYAGFLPANVEGVENMATACAARQTPPILVHVSSLAAAGPVPGNEPRDESDPPAPISQYGRSKRAGELVAERFADRLPITVVRPPIVFGERDKDLLFVFRFIKRRGWHAVPSLQTRWNSLVHATDLAQLLILAAERGSRLAHPESCHPDPNESVSAVAPPGYYFAACDEHPTYLELGRLIATAVGRDHVRILRTPEFGGWLLATAVEVVSRLRGRPAALNWDKFREATAGSWICSAERAKRELGFAPAAPLLDRLRQTAQWYEAHGWWSWRTWTWQERD